MGKIVVELYWDHAPNTCRNFAELSRRGYYNSTKFHRVVKDFIVQGGDPTGTGRGGASIYGKYFNDEITPLLKHTGNTKKFFLFFLFIYSDRSIELR
jgi:peptidyl-prolyl cis-trans isomerase-like 1